MNTALLVMNILLLVGLLGLAFLVLGALRALGVLTWRLDQMEVMRPSRIGREGLKIGRKAPNFTLPLAKPRPVVAGIGDHHVSLSDFVGHKVLLVLTQSGCGPCMEIVPELNRLHDRGEFQVLVINNGEPEGTRTWVAENNARFPVLSQEKFSLSKRYEVFVTPFAFLIDEQGIITSKGIAGSRQYLNYVLTGAGNKPGHDDEETQPETNEKSASAETLSSPSSQELIHV